MSKVSLKVVVAGRTYPLTVLESEVGKVERAAEAINNAIKQLQENFAVRDMQDLLAMTALQISTKTSKVTTETQTTSAQTADFSEVSSALKHLVQQINKLEVH